jgi:hemophore-related protein
MTSMKMSEKTVRRGLYGMLAGGLLGGVATAAIVLPNANAAPDQCSASGMATTQSSVSLSMSTYLQTHPQANQALTDIAKQTPTQAQLAYATYFADNPKVATDLKGIQQPVTDLNAKCGIQVKPNELTDALPEV